MFKSFRELVEKFWADALFILIIAAIVILFVYPFESKAEGTTANVTWKHPTSKIDGTPITVSDIARTTIIWRRPNSSAIVGTRDVSTPSENVSIQNLVCGDFIFSGITHLKDVASSPSEESPPSNLYSTKVSCNQANPPAAPAAS